MAVTWITPTDVTPGSASSWVDVDVSSLVPSGATGVLLHIEHNVAFTEYAIGVRKNGSTDNRIQNLYWTSQARAWVGLDGSRIFECYVGHTTNVNVYLVGYFGSESVFFTNGITKTAGGVGAYEDVDISSDTGGDTAIAALLETTRAGTAYQFALRKNGSTDDRYANSFTPPHMWAMVGVDGSEIFEQKVSNVAQALFLIGYMKSGATFHTNAIDRSTATTGSYVDLPALTSGMSGAAYHIHYVTSSDLLYSMRTKGSSDDIYRWSNRQAYAALEADASRIIQQKISTTNVDIWELAEFEAAVTGSTGVLNVTLGTLTGSATGTSTIVGTTTATLGAATAAATGAVAVAGASSTTLGTLTSTATGTADVVGALSQSLGALQVDAQGVVGTAPAEGTLAATLGTLTGSSTGTVAIQGTTTATLGAVTLASTATADVQGTTSATLGTLTLVAAGEGAAAGTGTAHITLGALTGTVQGTVDVQGMLAVTLGLLTSVQFGAYQAVARPGDRYRTTLPGTRTGSTLTPSATGSVITEA